MKKKNYLSFMAAICLLIVNSVSVFADGDTPVGNRSIVGYIYDALGNIIGYIYG
jgi:hypothetical protein